MIRNVNTRVWTLIFRMLFVLSIIFLVHMVTSPVISSTKNEISTKLSILSKEERLAIILEEGQTGRVLFNYDNKMPMIFVGGFPRSGTTLMRSMLDAHPQVRCGEETVIIADLLNLTHQWKHKDREGLMNAGITDEIIDSAVASFILDVIVKHGETAPILCNKDPWALEHMVYLNDLFPTAKFVLMIRDGRASVHSVISKLVPAPGLDLKNPRQCMEMWNQAVARMYNQCNLLGKTKCFVMYYEQLVLHPEKQMKDLIHFLEIPWSDSVLNHETLIGKEIVLNKFGLSSDQVKKPVNVDALTAWVGKYPEDVVKNMSQIAPMLKVLGYDPDTNPPNYGKPDDFVVKKLERKSKSSVWNLFS